MAAKLDARSSSSLPARSDNPMTLLPFPLQRDDEHMETKTTPANPPIQAPVPHNAQASPELAPPSRDDAVEPLAKETLRVLKNLDYLDEAWPLIVELRIPGTRARWTQRSHRLLGAPGENSVIKGASPPEDRLIGASSGAAPVDLSLLDLLARLAATADDIAAAVASVLDIDDVAAALPSAWLGSKAASAFRSHSRTRRRRHRFTYYSLASRTVDTPGYHRDRNPWRGTPWPSP